MTSESVAPSSRRMWMATLAVSAALLSAAADGRAQDAPPPTPKVATSGDPRIGLKPGLHNAGEAARHMEKVASLPKPPGFFDPKAPAGVPTPPERPRAADGSEPDDDAPDPPVSRAAGAAAGKARAAPRPERAALNFANSDIAFEGDRLFLGNFHGVNTYDIGRTDKPKLVASMVCPGGQGDVSVHGNLLFMSVEQTRGRLDCGTQGVTPTVSTERFRGVRIFDITDVKHPKQVAAVQTCRGSHTHTLVTSPSDPQHVYIYGSGTGAVRAAEELSECSGKDPKEDTNTALFSIDVIKVPLAAPDKAAIVNRPRIFADPKSGNIAGLWAGGSHGPGTQNTRLTNQCHDITVFPEIGLAAGACAGNGILMDISDPVHPVRLDHVVDKNFAYWHSATFNNDGSKVLFTDEWGGGTRPRCRASDPGNWGADAIFEVVDRKLRFAGYYKLPVAQTEQENCVAHNGSLIPVPGRDIMVQAWYQGGISVFDFTDAAHPVEIAFFDRGPLDAKTLITGGFWSAYWYKGHIYAGDMARGVDVFKLTPSEFLSKHELEAAMLVQPAIFNAQEQSKVTWPAHTAVARAYLDQLTRSQSIPAERVAAVNGVLERLDAARGGKGLSAAAAGDVGQLAVQLQSDAGAAQGADARRLKALAGALESLNGKTN